MTSSMKHAFLTCMILMVAGCASGVPEVQPVSVVRAEERQVNKSKTDSCLVALLMSGNDQIGTAFKVSVDGKITTYLTASHVLAGLKNKKPNLIYRCGGLEVTRKVVNMEKLASLDAVLLSLEKDIVEIPALPVKAAREGAAVNIPGFAAIGGVEDKLKGVMVPLSGDILSVQEGFVYFKANGIRPGASGAPIIENGNVTGIVVGRYVEKGGASSEFGYGIDMRQIFRAIASRFPGSGADRL